MKHRLSFIAFAAAMALPQASAACAQLSADVWMCDRGTVWEAAKWDVIGDGSARYIDNYVLNFTQEWPGHEITDNVATLEEQFATYDAWIEADGNAPLEVLQIDKIVTPRGLTLRHLQYDQINGDRTLSAIMLSQVGPARIMLYLDTADTTPLEDMEKMSFDVAMMLRDTCEDPLSCADTIDPLHTSGTD
ncbi:hypothetical protein [Sulfitobacter sp. AS59]|uniref:hypothetical protein n=1 Tax=Sulfitobacter sp. AS59 TaxID=3135784 RepID=UPI003170667C